MTCIGGYVLNCSNCPANAQDPPYLGKHNKIRQVDVYVSRVELTEKVEKTSDPPFKFSRKRDVKVSFTKNLF